jgi:DNA-binding MarR family transcriptional regulator
MAARRTGDRELEQAAAFRTELRRFLRRSDSVTAAAGLTPRRYDLLLVLESAGELRVTELCEALQLQQTAVTELVKRTEEAGLVERRASPEDGRVWLLRPTAEGRRRLRRAFEALRDDRVALASSFRDLDRSFRAGH